jgi:hypothetical protein
MKTSKKLYIVTNKNHPAYRKQFRIRRRDGGMVLCEWCTWSHICTWISVSDTNIRA